MSSTDRRLLGREQELDAIVGLLDERDRLPLAAVLTGEAGIGKTTVWLAACAAASTRGYRVLSCRPSEAETQFSYAGLTDLLGDAAGEVLQALPPIQQRALAAALLIGEPEANADERAVAAALLGALRLLSGEGPLCLAVDDLQWLDAASLAAIRFALARLDGEPMAALLAVRGDVPDWLQRAVLERRLHTFEVKGLSLGALHELLRDRLDAEFARPTLIRIWESSGGNPFYALELASALQRQGGTLALGDELPIPTTLDELLQARLDGLSPGALGVTRAVAALADPTVGVVEALVGAGSDDDLAEPLEKQILELAGERLRFTHPLLGSAVAARQTPAQRRSLHSRLATLVPSAEERARHLALATDQPDAEVAAELEAAARTAHAHGAPTAAAELAEHAVRLTPPADTEHARERLLFAAVRHHAAGDTARATALLGQARAAARGNDRATVLAHLAGIEQSPPAAVALLREALSEAKGDDALQATIHLQLADLMRFTDGLEHGLEHADLAVRAATRVGDRALSCRALAAYGLVHFNAGRGIPVVEMREALSLERTLIEWPLDDGAAIALGHQLFWSADLEGARELLYEVVGAASARNDPAGEAGALWYLSLVEWRAGNWGEADRCAAESVALDTQLGRTVPQSAFPAAIISAHRGQIGDARALAQRAVDRADAEGMRAVQSAYQWVLGFVELSLGDAVGALTYLRRAHEVRDDFMLEPGMHIELGDLLEALIAVDELDEAEDVLAAGQERADALDRAWTLAILGRCRALLLAARGDLEGAFSSFDRALAEHARSPDPFQQARTLLALGRTERRAKRRRVARATLEDALARFELLGAPLWVERTRSELARIGGRAPARGDLTEAETRVAALVAEGRTNREVAAALFLTEHSVETALTRIYRKLGVRSRSELASHYSSNS